MKIIPIKGLNWEILTEGAKKSLLKNLRVTEDKNGNPVIVVKKRNMRASKKVIRANEKKREKDWARELIHKTVFK